MNTQGIPLTTVGEKPPLIVIEQNGATGKIPLFKADKPSKLIQASTSSLSPNLDEFNLYIITALAANITINNPTGVVTEGDIFQIRIKDNATPRTLTFGSKYRGIGATLPVTTTASKTMYLTIIYNAIDDKFDLSAKEEV